jgi:CubicO group peptidase (beta-lactamase class C family)
MKTNSIFRIASQTKAIVSIGLLQLVEKNKISLDDPIEKWIPAFNNQKVVGSYKDSLVLLPRKRSITIRDLLSHQSGISSPDEYPALKTLFVEYGLDRTFPGKFKNLEEEVDKIGMMPLAHQPGERFSYGLSTDVVGRLIEIISGLNLYDYLKKNIFIPLHMRDTYFYLPENKKSRLVKLTYKDDQNNLKEFEGETNPMNFPLQKNTSYFSAIGGLVSTTHDYARFLQFILNEGRSTSGKIIIGKHMIDSFLTNQLGNKTFIFGGQKSLNNFGLGVGLTTKEGQNINHASEGSFFWGGAFNTAYMVDRKRKLITLFYFQRTPFVLPYLLSKLEKTTIDSIDLN